MIEGLDVSAWNHPQGAGINYPQVKASGHDIVMRRATWGLNVNIRGILTNSVDWWYPSETPQVAAAGLTDGAYHGLDPLSNVAAQAALFLQTIGTGPRLVALDLEPSVQSQVSAPDAVGMVDQFRAIVGKALNRPVMLYCDLARAQWLGMNPEWLASYGSAAPTGPVLWQDSDSGNVSGVSGPVDTDQWLGTPQDLLRYTGVTMPTPPDDPSNAEVVAILSSHTGLGYGIVAADGGVFTFGDFAFHGSAGAIKLNKPIVDAALTPSGNGYWLCAADGGIFTYGDAAFYGSTGNLTLVAPICRMAPTPTGLGYWLLALDGGVFAFGDAEYYGRVDFAGPYA